MKAGENRMKVIDVHAHIFPKCAGITDGAPMTGDSYGRVRVGTQLRQLAPPAFEQTRSTPETLLAYMDWLGIDQALLMPNPFYGYFNDYIADAVKRWPERFKGVALVNAIKGKQAADELESLYRNTPLFGFKVEVKSTFQCAPQLHMASEELMPVWECVNENRQSAFLHLFTDTDIVDLKLLIRRFPKITWVLCHMGADACFAPYARREAFGELLELMRTHPNVYMDTSTIAEYFYNNIGEEYPFPSAVARIREAAGVAGAEKLMYASDYPGMLKCATMEQLLNTTKKQCGFSGEELELVMHGNAERLFFYD